MFTRVHCISTMLVLTLALSSVTYAQTIGTAFTYQGRIKHNGLLLTQPCDLQFSLWTAESGGSQVGGTLTRTNVIPDKGLFTIGSGNQAALDFGAASFDGSPRWLQIAVRFPAGSGSYLPVLPRHRITPAPYAMNADVGGGWTRSGTNAFLTSGTGFVGIGTSAPAAHISLVDPGVGLHRTASQTLGLFTTGVERVRINSVGNVGIGTTNATHRLTVAGDASATGTISAGGAISGASVTCNSMTVNGPMAASSVSTGPMNAINIELTNDLPFLDFHHSFTGSDFTYRIINESGGLHFVTDPVAYSRTMFLSNNSRVAIGQTTTPSRLAVNGNVTADGYLTSSDRRLKRDFVPLMNALDTVLALDAWRFNWRVEDMPEKDLPRDSQLGFIAQDVQNVLPEVVIENGDGFLAIDYARLTPVLVEAVKELHAAGQDKDATIAQQQSQIDSLQARLAAVEARLNAVERNH